ncbi:GGDEF domain-containing protein [Candidatus Thiodiazotropha sp. CDECU1]|uniref:GGDEF domain-containing protein n=1 Tax=Candidatus Thiodiazotropha sp. CDECU1 TaxID=3065865 RepID=UPI002931E089|nr:diguanylate cyclase [Candidatus Thiodiazotropha sp. CDECU1]
MAEISFNQKLFDVCPTGMLAIDSEVCIRWMNPALEAMLDLSGEELIGKDKNTLPASLHALFDETDMLHLSLNGDGERWLQREVREVVDGKNTQLRLHFYHDISQLVLAQRESDQLRRQVEDLTITDELTGMANRRATIQAIGAQVTRSRRYGNLLTLGGMRLSHPDQAGDSLPETSILVMTQYLRERLRWADVIGRYEDQLFLLVMPETSIADGKKLLQQIVNECRGGALQGLGDNPVPDLQFGVSEWSKGDDAQRLIVRVIESIEA